MSLGQVTLFNIKRDISEHQTYVLTALIAIAGIVFSTQMFRITALQGVNPRIVLGGSIGLLGIETLVLMKRNVTRHYRVGSDDFGSIMRRMQSCAFINNKGKKVYVKKELDGKFALSKEPEKTPWYPRYEVMLVLGKSDAEIESLINNDETFKTELQSRLKDGEYCVYKKANYSKSHKIDSVESKKHIHLYILMGRYRNDN